MDDNKVYMRWGDAWIPLAELVQRIEAAEEYIKALSEKINDLEDHLNTQIANFRIQTRYYYYEQEKSNLLENHVKNLEEKINDLEKRLVEVEDQYWMNHDSGVPSEKLTTEEILESVKELKEKKREEELDKIVEMIQNSKGNPDSDVFKEIMRKIEEWIYDEH